MTLPGHLEPQVLRRALAGLLSAAAHVGLILLIALSGGRHDGVGASETPLTQLVLIEAREADHREGLDLTPIEPSVARMADPQPMPVAIEPPVSAAADEIGSDLADVPVPHPIQPPAAIDPLPSNAIHPAPTFVMLPQEQSALSQRLARLAEQLGQQPQAQVTWEQDGTQYSAVLIPERANDGMALERVVVEVSAAGRGGRLTTRVILKRLAFSQFSQMVDRWDPMVQMHDDVIVGRFHSNSRFNVLHDSGGGPKFLGKVTTAARSFSLRASSPGGRSEMFRGGVETRAGQIHLPEALQPSEWSPPEAAARIHELADDTHIRFFGDGSYRWVTRGAPAPEYLNAPSEHPVYFVAAPGATLHVKGVVAGKILVYSPERIIIEGSLTYAHDPREVAGSRDYLGLVCDKYIEVAAPGVTGPGDLEIDGAILARRRFIVRDTDHHRSATLRIFGSLAAGSLSASEPRYATKIEYDERFEQRRPPGFPSTNRYEVEDWDGQWVKEVEEVEAPEHYADEAF
jgi:hypothetical protein